MNWFVIANGFAYMGAAGYSIWYGHPMWAMVWLCYGASAFLLAVLEVQPK